MFSSTGASKKHIKKKKLDFDIFTCNYTRLSEKCFLVTKLTCTEKVLEGIKFMYIKIGKTFEHSLTKFRFVALAKVGNKEKKKWMYAFNVTPMKNLERAELVAQPQGVTDVPFTQSDIEIKVRLVLTIFCIIFSYMKTNKCKRDTAGPSDVKTLF